MVIGGVLDSSDRLQFGGRIGCQDVIRDQCLPAIVD
jgi:hypothetical protein